ncbi:hypothetical protein BDV25DRAFT_172091 [Aspergillus avenaceus]|uniref:FAD-binding domain-containing protein n=1 Tax=Aspergillus avenaceus TaxID=36643 RepID=A0A5N6U7Q2_ASPAV|nr:hypothetical protein BDV25DRAFT_172091 [Aspergillus avenaceus]
MTQFKVLIAGGSIAGLALAIMLEKNNIDFLVLEARADIAPQVGASIALQANGLRILDQLGLYEEIWEHVKEHPIQSNIYHRPNGEKMWEIDHLTDEMVKRHGYLLSFMDRQTFLQMLYNKVQDKSRILTKKRVNAVEMSDDLVRVSTTDGATYYGDILVGADGIHSIVRREMARLDGVSGRDYLEEKSLSATYNCVFGIAHRTPGIEPCTIHDVFNEKFSYLIPDGPGDRTYFFLAEHMGQTHYGPNIPHLTDEDRDEIVSRHLQDPITPDVKFGDIHARKIRAVATTLPEHVYKHWHYGRLIALGDSSHKFHPLSGQGANSAFETTACFTNALIARLQAARPRARLSQEEITEVFETVQQTRIPRAWQLVKASGKRQRLEAMDTPRLAAYAANNIPKMPAEFVYKDWLKVYPPAVSLDMLPRPYRPHSVPYDDEKEPRRRGNGKAIALL